MLTLAALVTALSTGFVLTVVAFVALAQVPVVAAFGRWSVHALAAGEPLPRVAGALCGLVAVALMAAAVHRVVVATRDLAVAEAACRRLGAGTDGLVVVQDAEPDAYALPGLSGRVVVSTAMLRALPAAERRVLLAHEAAHLRRRHHLYVQLAELSAAANPLLRPVATAVRSAVERWADEDAAVAVGDRVVAARAVARASLAQRGSRGVLQAVGVALRMADSLAVARTKALLAPAPRPQRPLTVAVAGLVLLGAAGAIAAGHYTEHLFEVAEHVAALRPLPGSR
jgi:Zn-dependent protease with chaperone function